MSNKGSREENRQKKSKIANCIIYPEMGVAMEYRNLMKDDQNKKSGGTNMQMNWGGWHKV